MTKIWDRVSHDCPCTIQDTKYKIQRDKMIRMYVITPENRSVYYTLHYTTPIVGNPLTKYKCSCLVWWWTLLIQLWLGLRRWEGTQFVSLYVLILVFLLLFLFVFSRTSEIDHVALAVVGYSPALASRSSLLLSGIKVTATSGPNLLPRQSGTSSSPSLVSSFVTWPEGS